jgi:hypothetical protein
MRYVGARHRCAPASWLAPDVYLARGLAHFKVLLALVCAPGLVACVRRASASCTGGCDIALMAAASSSRRFLSHMTMAAGNWMPRW